MPTPSPLETIRARIAAAARGCGRQPDAIALVAVSKTHDAERIADLLRRGHRRFGENRVQEAQSKFPALRAAAPDLLLHLIGPLQTNKARDAVRLFDVIETLDRPRLADAIARAAEQEGRLPELLVQVNIADEPQKAGVPRGQAETFIEACRVRFGATLTGLMCIPPEGQDPLPHFRELARIAGASGLTGLSMGMSGDFETAIAAGATEVRVGSALFGARPAAEPVPLATRAE
ncbi:YggS family pyridoxal phosphate-dependent enzyme [Lichenicoccus sp.]|uniref:YggS family pyridoxal phosphate-dependent enzyme n=1 Tax=Lichenicoccus sp. TaxID=2781899 RepID=UPI003D0BA670